MYDILQLNEMLVPELLDIAEQLKIASAKKLGKQELVYKILDSQAIAGSKGAKPADDGKRKRIIKTNTSTGVSEEAVVESGEVEKPIIKKPIMAVKKDDKTPIKKARKKPDEKEPVAEIVVEPQPSDVQPTGEQPDTSKMEENKLIQAMLNEGNQQSAENPSGAGQNKFYPPPPRAEPAI